MPTTHQEFVQKTKRNLVKKLELRHRLNARDIFDAFAVISRGRSGLSQSNVESLFPYVEMVFDRLGLSGRSERHWKFAALILSFALFGGREGGRRAYWTAKRRKQLRKDVEAMRKENPKLSKLEICRLLLANDPKYAGKDHKPDSLRRALYKRNKDRAPKRKARENDDNWE